MISLVWYLLGYRLSRTSDSIGQSHRKSDYFASFGIPYRCSAAVPDISLSIVASVCSLDSIQTLSESVLCDVHDQGNQTELPSNSVHHHHCDVLTICWKNCSDEALLQWCTNHQPPRYHTISHVVEGSHSGSLQAKAAGDVTDVLNDRKSACVFVCSITI